MKNKLNLIKVLIHTLIYTFLLIRQSVMSDFMAILVNKLDQRDFDSRQQNYL